MPALVDTTVRLVSQDPLAGRLPTAAILELAALLDDAGFAALEVSGGGVFDSAVRRGVESPWERIRAIRARTKTPLGMALRGRFLVGSRPVGGDFVRRFVASAAENGIGVFRLHDPLNDVSNLREAGEAITGRRVRVRRGPHLQPGPDRRDRRPRRAGEEAPRPRRCADPAPRPVRLAGAASGGGAGIGPR
jgi:oxaloacetate decarboxylase alpha subunit